MDEEYLRSIRHWLCAEPRPLEERLDLEAEIPLPRIPVD